MLIFVVLAFIPESSMQPVILLFLGVHVLLHGGLYYLVAILAAKAISWIPRVPARNVIVGIVCAGLAGIALLPVYGGGGHGPMRWMTLPQALADVSKGHGVWAAAVVYGTAALALGIAMLVRLRRAWPQAV